MKINRRHFTIRLIKKLLALFFVPLILIATSSNSGKAANDLDYFKGVWNIQMRNNPDTKVTWTVREDLDGSWLNGSVELNGKRTSMDFWRHNANKIERYAFTSNGIVVRVEGSGWVGNWMIMTGVMSDKNGETKVRETITKVDEQQFNALWEMASNDGKWTVFGDEICKKQN